MYKKINSKFLRHFQMAYVLLTLFMSFVFIPQCHPRSDFFLFFKWDLFSNGPRKSFYDITWDGGKSFLFRDHRNNKREFISLFYLTQRGDIGKLRNLYLREIKESFVEMGPTSFCDKLFLVKLKGPLYKHILFKEKLDIVEEIPICES